MTRLRILTAALSSAWINGEPDELLMQEFMKEFHLTFEEASAVKTDMIKKLTSPYQMGYERYRNES